MGLSFAGQYESFLNVRGRDAGGRRPGLGEAVVGGAVTPDSYARSAGRRVVGDKAVMVVPAEVGTREVPVPEERRRAAVLDDARLAELEALGSRVEALFGVPVDVGWVWGGDGFAVVQARPITGVAEVWNDSLRGDYLWTCANLREAVPSVMTPVTWSLVRAITPPDLAGHPMAGNIGGRFYLNVSPPFAIAGALGLGGVVRS